MTVQPDHLVARASALHDVGRGDEALALAGQALAVDPGHAVAHAIACRVHLVADRPRVAWEHALAILRRDPDDAQGHLLLSLTETQLGRTDLALQEAQRVCELAPHASAGHIAATAACLNRPRLAATARRAAGSAVERAPQDPDSHLWVARAHMYNGRSRVPRADRAVARAAIEEALRLDPRHAESLSERATLDAMGFSWRSALRGHADVLADDPHAQESMGAIAFTFGRMIWWAHLVVWLAWLVAGVSIAATQGEQRWLAHGAGLLALAATGGSLFVIRRALGRTFWAHLRAFPGRDIWGAIWFALLIFITLCVVVAGWLPGEGFIVPIALGKLAIWAAVITSWIRRFRS